MTVLPQNTQNGLRPTQKTQKIFRKHGVRTSVYSVCREAASVCSVAKTAGTEGGIPQNTQNGLTPDTEHTENFQKAWGFGLQCIQCAAKRLQCVQWPKTAGTVGWFYHRTHRTGLRPTPNTQKIFGRHGVRTSVYSVCREAASVCSVVEKEAA